MDVRLKNVRDRNLPGSREFEVAVHVRAGVEHRGHACGIISHQIGKLGDAVGLYGFKYEGHDLLRLMVRIR